MPRPIFARPKWPAGGGNPGKLVKNSFNKASCFDKPTVYEQRCFVHSINQSINQLDLSASGVPPPTPQIGKCQNTNWITRCDL